MANLSDRVKILRRKIKIRAKHFAHLDFYGFADFYNAETWFWRLFWAFILLGACLAAAFMTYVQISTWLAAPTTAKISSMMVTRVPYPILTICDSYGTFFLNHTKLKEDGVSSSATKLMLLSGPVWVLANKDIPRSSLFDNQEDLRYVEDMTVKHGSPPEALQAFYRQYGVKCEEIMESCMDASFTTYNCCDIFRPTFHLSNGLCFSSDAKRMPLIMAPALFSNFFVYLRNSSFHLDPTEPVANDTFQHRPGYSFVLDTGLDQGVWRADSLDVEYRSQTFVNLKIKRITLEAKECDEEPELEYFSDYTFSNCMWEKRLLLNPGFHRPNDCRFPATHLTKLGLNFLHSEPLGSGKHSKESQRWCSLREIWDLVYRDVDGPDFKPDGMYNRVMYWTKELNMSNENPCKDPCDHMEYTHTWRRQANVKNITGARLGLSMIDPQWPAIKEVTVLEWYDFVALIGGLWLLWVGVSLVTVVQFLVASLKFCCHCLLPSEIDLNDH